MLQLSAEKTGNGDDGKQNHVITQAVFLHRLLYPLQRFAHRYSEFKSSSVYTRWRWGSRQRDNK
jgi:hypothetical protein